MKIFLVLYSNRKGNLIILYDWTIKAKIKGSSADGKENEGTINMTNFCDENEISEVEVKFCVCCVMCVASVYWACACYKCSDRRLGNFHCSLIFASSSGENKTNEISTLHVVVLKVLLTYGES